MSDTPMPRWTEYMAVDLLVPDPRNPKSHDDDLLDASLKRFQFTEQPMIDERTGMLVAGHGRREMVLRARDAGLDPPEGIIVDDGVWKMPIQRGWSSVDDDEAGAYLVTSNRTVEKGGWNDPDLADLLDATAKTSAAGLEGVGYTQAELDELLASIAGESGGRGNDPDELPEPPVSTSKLGDLWILGQHRLLCGDATSSDDIDRLLAGQRPGAIFTDPPYGMNLDTDFQGMHPHGGNTYERVIGDDVDFDAAAIIESFADIKEQFWWGADYYRTTIPAGGSWIVWDKRFTDGEMELERALGGQFELCWSRQKHRREVARVLWCGHHGMQAEDTKRRIHPTQKPTGLVTWFFERWVTAGAIVLDLFGGSGSTLIACDMTDRKARLMELDPAYVDIICRRYQDLTGERPILEATGEPHDFTT